MLPFTIDRDVSFDYEPGDYLYVPQLRSAVEAGLAAIPATVVHKNGTTALTLRLSALTPDEREIILRGCLMNYYAAHKK